MNKKELEERLRRCKKIRFRAHALERMKKRGITRKLVVENLKEGRISECEIEKDHISKKHVLGYRLSGKRSLYVVVRFKRQEIYIITAIVSNRRLLERSRRRIAKWRKRRR